MTGLRGYQRQAVEAVRRSVSRGNRGVLVVAPTGAGKTHMTVGGIIAPELARGRRVVFVVHLREVIDATSRRLAAMDLPHGVIMAGRKPDRRAPVQVCSLQTLDRRADYPDADLVIIDECHRAASSQYRRLAEKYPRARILGLTATPTRLDGRPLSPPSAPFTELVQAVQPSTLIAGGYLVPSVVYGADAPDLAALKTDPRTHDYRRRELSAAMQAKPSYIGDAVQNWRHHAQGKRTITFSVDRRHGQSVCKAFQSAGVPSAYVDGSTPVRERQRALDRLRSGDVRVLVNVDVYTEGFDEPLIECVQVLRPTLSLARWIQMAGRGARIITPEYAASCKRDGIAVPAKQRMLVLDHGGNAQRHGLPLDDRDWSLDGEVKLSRSFAPERPLVRCEKCGAMKREGRPCPGCNARPDAPPAFVPAILRRLGPGDVMGLK